MTSYQPTQGYIDAFQRLDPVQAAGLMHTQDQMIESLQRQVERQNKIIVNQEQAIALRDRIIQRQEGEIEGIKSRLDELDAIAKLIPTRSSDQN